MRKPRCLPMRVLLLAGLGCATACSGSQDLPPSSQVGPDPALPAPSHRLIPRVDIAPAVGWTQGRTPVAAPGLAVNAFAGGLVHPRWLLVLPNGDVLVAESNGPAGKSGITGIKGKVMGRVMKKAGAGVPSPDRITLLRDADGDGTAESQGVFLAGLHSPFGMALVGDWLYVANADALVRVAYSEGARAASRAPEHVVDLPGKGRFNHHWTKSLLASPDGRTLYVGVGSNSNVGENGLAVEAMRASILAVDLATRAVSVYATGLRNPVGMDWNPDTGALWTVVNERDELGDDLVPDYLTSVKPGAHYGWPWSYYGQHVDARVKPPNPAMVARAVAPDYALGSHVAPLGLAFYTGTRLPAHYRHGAFVGLHGSWNRKPLAGYEVVFVPFANGKPAGQYRRVLTGFVDADGKAMGRPVGVAVDTRGAVLVADDVGNTVWRITPANAAAAAPGGQR
jgi:glucose/arabinose dehydrogenase